MQTMSIRVGDAKWNFKYSKTFALGPYFSTDSGRISVDVFDSENGYPAYLVIRHGVEPKFILRMPSGYRDHSFVTTALHKSAHLHYRTEKETSLIDLDNGIAIRTPRNIPKV